MQIQLARKAMEKDDSGKTGIIEIMQQSQIRKKRL
jgi:hypothetical protein